jgi:hypothetical protein
MELSSVDLGFPQGLPRCAVAAAETKLTPYQRAKITFKLGADSSFRIFLTRRRSISPLEYEHG